MDFVIIHYQLYFDL